MKSSQIIIPTKSQKTIDARKKIYKFLQKFDVIHFHELWSIKTIFLSYFAGKISSKHFFVGHGYLDPWSINEKYIKKKLFI